MKMMEITEMTNPQEAREMMHEKSNNRREGKE
jgi:hypothetical protein